MFRNIGRYDIHFLEIGFDGNHVHFLIQSIPMMSAKKIANTIKSLTAREIFRLHPEVKRFLWGGKFGQVVIILTQLVNM